MEASNAQPFLPGNAMGSLPSTIAYDEAKQLLSGANTELSNAKKNAHPVTSWGRRAHGNGFCPYCPKDVQTPLRVDPTTGLFMEACLQHQFLMDNLHLAKARVRRFETMVKRIKSGEIVPRSEMEDPWDSQLTKEEQSHLRSLGFVHRDEIHNAVEKMIEELRLLEEVL
tara:strand:- start:167 stop:673 length:507 start_codon:yes stop_codon:yes gene_type:complete